MFDVRPRRMLRFLAEPPCDEALSLDRSSDYHVRRARRDLGLVLRGRGGALGMTSDELKNAYSALSTGSGSRGDLEHSFPRLSAEQIARLSHVGRERHLTDGEVLW